MTNTGTIHTLGEQTRFHDRGVTVVLYRTLSGVAVGVSNGAVSSVASPEDGENLMDTASRVEWSVRAGML